MKDFRHCKDKRVKTIEESKGIKNLSKKFKLITFLKIFIDTVNKWTDQYY